MKCLHFPSRLGPQPPHFLLFAKQNNKQMYKRTYTHIYKKLGTKFPKGLTLVQTNNIYNIYNCGGLAQCQAAQEGLKGPISLLRLYPRLGTPCLLRLNNAHSQEVSIGRTQRERQGSLLKILVGTMPNDQVRLQYMFLSLYINYLSCKTLK